MLGCRVIVRTVVLHAKEAPITWWLQVREMRSGSPPVVDMLVDEPFLRPLPLADASRAPRPSDCLARGLAP